MECPYSHNSASLSHGSWYAWDFSFKCLRCTHCGHRITTDGIVPLQTLSYPPWMWVLELRGRARAKTYRDGPRW